MPAWIHNRAEHLLAKNPSMKKETAFAIATQQSHKVGKTPKGYGTSEGKREAKAKFDKPKKEYVKGANPGNLETPKLNDKPKTRWTGKKLVKAAAELPSYDKVPEGHFEFRGKVYKKDAELSARNKKLTSEAREKGLYVTPSMGTPVGQMKTAMVEEFMFIMLNRKEKLAEEHKDKTPGGKADDKQLKDYPKDQLEMGQKVEMEHTDDPALAREISMDHLEEFPDYYTRLKKMEEEGEKDKKAKEKTANGVEEKGEDEGPGRAATKKDVANIIAYMKKRKPGEEDDEFHEFAEGRGMNVHEAEEAVYDELGKALKKQGEAGPFEQRLPWYASAVGGTGGALLGQHLLKSRPVAGALLGTLAGTAAGLEAGTAAGRQLDRTTGGALKKQGMIPTAKPQGLMTPQQRLKESQNVGNVGAFNQKTQGIKLQKFKPMSMMKQSSSKLAFQTSQYSGPLGPGRMSYRHPDAMPGFVDPPVKTAGPPPGEEGERREGVKAMKEAAARLKMAAAATTPAGRLASSQQEGQPKTTNPPGPSIQQISKPVGYGRPLPGTTLGIS